MACLPRQAANLTHAVSQPRPLTTPQRTPAHLQFSQFALRVGTTSCGAGPCQFNCPRGVSVDEALDRVRVADSENCRVVILDLEGNRISAFGRKGSGEGEFYSPVAIAAAPGSHLLYIADLNNHRVVKMTDDGKHLAHFGVRGKGAGQLNRPSGIAVSGGRVYVSEEGNHRVQAFDTDGRHLAAYGSGEEGSAKNQFDHPRGIAIFEQKLYVADYNNHRIQVVDVRSKLGFFKKPFGMQGSRRGHFVHPSDGTRAIVLLQARSCIIWHVRNRFRFLHGNIRENVHVCARRDMHAQFCFERP